MSPISAKVVIFANIIRWLKPTAIGKTKFADCNISVKASLLSPKWQPKVLLTNFAPMN